MARLCGAPLVHACGEHRQGPRPHARYGNEFVLACDMRFACRQSAVFGNPEIGVGLIPGGGALEWLPRLVGRSRALEIVLSGDDFDADIAERYGWVNRTLDDDDLDAFVDTLARRLTSFDRETLAAAKAQLNRFGMPTATELQSSNDVFWAMLALPSAQARRAKVRGIGYGLSSDFELNFGRYLRRLGRRTTTKRTPTDRCPSGIGEPASRGRRQSRQARRCRGDLNERSREGGPITGESDEAQRSFPSPPQESFAPAGCSFSK